MMSLISPFSCPKFSGSVFPGLVQGLSFFFFFVLRIVFERLAPSSLSIRAEFTFLYCAMFSL